MGFNARDQHSDVAIVHALGKGTPRVMSVGVSRLSLTTPNKSDRWWCSMIQRRQFELRHAWTARLHQAWQNAPDWGFGALSGSVPENLGHLQCTYGAFGGASPCNCWHAITCGWASNKRTIGILAHLHRNRQRAPGVPLPLLQPPFPCTHILHSGVQWMGASGSWDCLQHSLQRTQLANYTSELSGDDIPG